MMFDLQGAPAAGYDVVTVLVPDGPVAAPSGAMVGNTLNDLLGVDATEVWLLDENRRVLRGDVQQTGVGAAGRLLWSEIEGTGARYVLVRPWVRPPAGYHVYLGGTELAYAQGPAHVGAGRMRVLFNDWQAGDADDDGVSNRVEARLLTCDGIVTRVAGSACVTVTQFLANARTAFMDPRDTDGDGLSDGAEIMGTDYARGTPTAASGACLTLPSPLTVPTQVIGNAGQTFPLWSFSPRHKDSLVEIDMAYQLPPGQNCSSELQGCEGGRNIALAAEGGNEQTMLVALRGWHRRFAELPASRVNNPDGLDGIALHFDVTARPVSTAHGFVPLFLLQDEAEVLQPGIITYMPPGGSGSTCSCAGILNCVDPRHGGLARYASVGQRPGGGNSGTNGTVNCALFSGQTCAHEMGHNLGLQHGGPTAANGNPFGLAPGSFDLLNESKLVHRSIMDYTYYSSDGDTPFSLGRFIPSPLPRESVDYQPRPGGGFMEVGSRFGYPEVRTVNGDTTQFFPRYDSRLTSGPAGCFGDDCIHLDVDEDGAFGGVVQRQVEQGGWNVGQHTWIAQRGYYCPAEQLRVSADEGSRQIYCCGNGLRSASTGLCPPVGDAAPVLPSLPAMTRTMLQSGQPAATVAAGRFYGFFMDDVVPDVGPPWDRAYMNRWTCSVRDEASVRAPLPAGAPCPAFTSARVRWAAFDSFRLGPGMTDPRQCGAADADCVDPSTGNQLGDLRIDGASPSFTGTTLLASATIQDATGQYTFLAYAQRTGGSYGGRVCTEDTTPACVNDWGPLEVRMAAANQLETEGVRTYGPTGLGLFADVSAAEGVTHGAHVSGVTLVAWDPADGGRRTRAVLVAREAGAPGQPNGRLFWTLCSSAAGCGQMRPLTALDFPSGSIREVTSTTTVAAAVEHPAIEGLTDGGTPRLVLVFGQPEPLGRPYSNLLAVRMSPQEPGATDFDRTIVPIERRGAPWEAANESALSVAFTRPPGSRMILALEPQSGSPIARFTATVREFQPGDRAYQTLTYYENQWDIVRLNLANETDEEGHNRLRRSDAPGSLPALALDDRGNVTNGIAGLDFLAGQVRGVRGGQAQLGPVFVLNARWDPAPFASLHDYDDSQTLAFNLCPGIGASSRGRAAVDLEASRLGRLRCPSGSAWGQNSGALGRIFTETLCLGTCLRGPLPPDYLELITQYVTNETMYHGPVQADPEQGRMIRLSTNSNACWYGNVQGPGLIPDAVPGPTQ